jgi:hypothetical protein
MLVLSGIFYAERVIKSGQLEYGVDILSICKNNVRNVCTYSFVFHFPTPSREYTTTTEGDPGARNDWCTK